MTGSQMLMPLIVFATLGTSSSRAQVPDALAGEWVGGTNLLGGWRMAGVRFSRTDAGWQGSFDLQPANAIRLPIAPFALGLDSIRFEIASPLGIVRAAGTVVGGIINAKLSADFGASGSLHLIRAAPLPAEVFSRHVGTYRLSDGTLLVVTFRPFGQLAAIQVSDSAGLETVVTSFALVPRDAATFLPSSALLETIKPGAAVEFSGSGAGSISWTNEAGVRRTGDRVPDMTQEWVVIGNGAVTLNATLFMPVGIDRPPVVVSVGGSGPTTRDGVLVRTRELVRAGLGVLVYDKRGTGDESGQWNSTIEELASDARAALRYLDGRRDLERGRIGIHGHSQGGWVVQRALSEKSPARFAIFTSSPPMAPMEQEVYRAGAQVRAADGSASEVAAAETLMRLKWTFGLTGAGWDEYAAALAAARGKPWASPLEMPATQTSQLWKDVVVFRDFDPTRYLRKIRVPSLVLLGANDREVPPTRSAAEWRRLLGEARVKDVSVVEIPGVGHSLFQSSARRGVVDPTAQGLIRRWLERIRPPS